MNMDFFNQIAQAFGLTAQWTSWLPAVLAACIPLLAVLFCKVGLTVILGKLKEGEHDQFRQAVAETRKRISLGLGVLIGAAIGLAVSPKASSFQDIPNKVAFVLICIQGLLIANIWVRYSIFKVIGSRLSCSGATNISLSRNLTTLFIGAIWLVSLIFVLDNFGYNVGAVIAGLGVGGIAIGLALQSTLGDIIASFTIQIDKPFEEGDFVIIDTFLGTIESIGLKTSRVRSLSGELLVFPNNVLVSQIIKNYKKMTRRRVVFRIGFEYSTDHDSLVRFPEEIRSIISAHDLCQFDRSHFCEYADSALIIETVYYVDSPDFNVYAGLHEQILLAVRLKVQEMGMSMAFPTRTLEAGPSLLQLGAARSSK